LRTSGRKNEAADIDRPIGSGDLNVKRANLSNAWWREDNDRQFDNCHREVKRGRKDKPLANSRVSADGAALE
jgi:hypothetical protein